MRTIPFKVVALLGMDSGTFPRAGEMLGFDLMEHTHERGDRVPRDDDRMTFLETIAAARKHLIVTWTGIRATDRRELDAAGPVAELMEAVRRGLDPAGAVRQASPVGLPELPEPVLVKHPLQPFTPSNFRAQRPLSFDLRYLSGACQIVLERTPLPAQWPGGELLAEREPTRVEVGELASSIAAPSEWFCKNRLGVRMKSYDVQLQEREPIAPDRLEQWNLRDQVLKWQVDGVSDEVRARSLSGSGVMPLGAAEKLLLAETEDAVSLIVDRVRELCTDTPQSVPIALSLDGFDIYGTIARVHLKDGRRVLFRASSLKNRYIVSLWVEHLALIAALKRPMESHLVCHKSHLELRAVGVSEAREYLRVLYGLHLQGRRGPLPFFADSSWKLFDHGLAPANAQELPSDVRDAWRKRYASYEGDSDSSDPHVKLLYSDRLQDDDFPFRDAGFLAATGAILAPLHKRHARHDLGSAWRLDP